MSNAYDLAIRNVAHDIAEVGSFFISFFLISNYLRVYSPVMDLLQRNTKEPGLN